MHICVRYEGAVINHVGRRGNYSERGQRVILILYFIGIYYGLHGLNMEVLWSSLWPGELSTGQMPTTSDGEFMTTGSLAYSSFYCRVNAFCLLRKHTYTQYLLDPSRRVTLLKPFLCRCSAADKPAIPPPITTTLASFEGILKILQWIKIGPWRIEPIGIWQLIIKKSRHHVLPAVCHHIHHDKRWGCRFNLKGLDFLWFRI